MAETEDHRSPKQTEIHFVEPLRSESNSSGEIYKPRPRTKSHHLSSTTPPSRSWLLIQARVWRALMSLGMPLHDLKSPRPPKPSFIKYIETLPRGSKPISLYFYTPRDYEERIQTGHKYPLVVNFHGGGFCLGNPTDDRYWAGSVVKNTSSVVVSVGYRLAPEHPYPTAIDDAVDTLVYLAGKAEELGLDVSRTALSGFSAGANLAITTPLRLKYHARETLDDCSDDEELTRWLVTHNQLEASANLKIVSIVAWYPILDWTESRASKKRNSIKPSKALPKFFTDLFDHSYIPVPDIKGNAACPYVSPALAPSNMLRDGLPEDIQLFLCEYDMLLREGKLFSERLEKLNKNVSWRIIPGVPHGWDKSPNPLRDQDAISALYARACAGLRESFGLQPIFGLNKTASGASGAQELHPSEIPRRMSVRTSIPV